MAPSLHVIYRYTAAENRRPRPPWFSKSLALASAILAARNCASTTTLHFVVDGPVSPAVDQALANLGSVLHVDGGWTRPSYLRALEFALQQPWPPDDVVYFCEDDYLHASDAFRELMRAASALPHAEFFSLYEHPDAYPGAPGVAHGSDATERVYISGDRHWRTLGSTCMTYGAQIATLERFALMQQHPLTKDDESHWDHLLWKAQQNAIARAVYDSSRRLGLTPSVTVRRGLRLLVSPEVHAVTRVRTLVAPMPSLATHAQKDVLALGVDWSAVAAEIGSWQRAHNLPSDLL
jgi:hypothetical protein